MRQYWLWIMIYVLFLLEGSILKWIIPSLWQSKVSVVPHLVLIVILFVALYVGRHYALICGLAFGFLQDIVYYGHALGVHSFSLGLAGYAIGLAGRLAPRQLFNTIVLIMMGNVLYDLLVFGIYRFFLRVVSIDFEWIILYRMLPSLIINVIFALLIYVPIRKMLENMKVFEIMED